ncbi:unnamed protein product [Natator depressus]
MGMSGDAVWVQVSSVCACQGMVHGRKCVYVGMLRGAGVCECVGMSADAAWVQVCLCMHVRGCCVDAGVFVCMSGDAAWCQVCLCVQRCVCVCVSGDAVWGQECLCVHRCVWGDVRCVRVTGRDGGVCNSVIPLLRQSKLCLLDCPQHRLSGPTFSPKGSLE